MATPTAHRSSQARGLHESCSCRPTPQPQQCRTWAASVTYSTAHPQCQILNPLSKARIKPASSWTLVGFVTVKPQQELPPKGHEINIVGYNHWFKNKVLNQVLIGTQSVPCIYIWQLLWNNGRAEQLWQGPCDLKSLKYLLVVPLAPSLQISVLKNEKFRNWWEFSSKSNHRVSALLLCAGHWWVLFSDYAIWLDAWFSSLQEVSAFLVWLATTPGC